MKMTPLKTDLSIWKELGLKLPPVGVKYLNEDKPEEEIEKLKGEYTLCEMIKVAQNSGGQFYMNVDNECCGGAFVMGMRELEAGAYFGNIGVELGLFQDARCNSRLYEDLPRMHSNTVNTIVFSPLDKIDFDPDVFFVLASIDKAETVMRAVSYSTGERYHALGQAVMSCAFLFVYPMMAGQVNYMVSALPCGIKGWHVFEPGEILIAIPYQWLSIVTKSLEEMDLDPPLYKLGRDKYKEDFVKIIGKYE